MIELVMCIRPTSNLDAGYFGDVLAFVLPVGDRISKAISLPSIRIKTNRARAGLSFEKVGCDSCRNPKPHVINFSYLITDGS